MTSTTTLRVWAEELVPASITSAFGLAPTRSFARGDKRLGRGGREYAPHKVGGWLFEAAERDPSNLNDQIAELLARFPPAGRVWNEIREVGSIDLYCGYFMVKTNEELRLSAETIFAIGSRGIELILDIYDPTPDHDAERSIP